SVIRSLACQDGKVGDRLILGPFRFANHDCSPNCQIMPIVKSSAYTLCAIRNIAAGEDITINYSKDGTYFNGASCGCATCNPDAPPVAKKRAINYSEFTIPNSGKRKPRGGKRSSRAKKRRLTSRTQPNVLDSEIQQLPE
ncbi:hypothetical protein BJ912DRAFT_869433, partial [Pholiota molesta]